MKTKKEEPITRKEEKAARAQCCASCNETPGTHLCVLAKEQGSSAYRAEGGVAYHCTQKRMKPPRGK